MRPQRKYTHLNKYLGAYVTSKNGLTEKIKGLLLSGFSRENFNLTINIWEAEIENLQKAETLKYIF